MMPGSVHAARQRLVSAAARSNAAGTPSNDVGTGSRASNASRFDGGEAAPLPTLPPSTGKAFTRKKTTGSTKRADVHASMAGSGPVMRRPPRKKRLFPGQSCQRGTRPGSQASGSGSSEDTAGDRPPKPPPHPLPRLRSGSAMRSMLNPPVRSGNGGRNSKRFGTTGPDTIGSPFDEAEPDEPRPKTTGAGSSRWSSRTDSVDASAVASSPRSTNK
mmetsp:Transcript_67349/g.186663  ORF Transcript_67349/g.186663 Transcript_67349/m.186663 type:complete len:216 (-) Transcript_67349:166-813(-)